MYIKSVKPSGITCGQNSIISFGNAASSVSSRCACTTDDSCTWEECDAGMELPAALTQFAKIVDGDSDQVLVLGGSLSRTTTSNKVYLTDLTGTPPETVDVGMMLKGGSAYSVGDIQGVMLKQDGKSYAVLVGGISGGPGTQIGGDNIAYIDITGVEANGSSHEYEVMSITNLAELIKPPGASGTTEEWSKISGSCAALYGSQLIVAGGYSETTHGYLDSLFRIDLADLSSPDVRLIGRLPKAVADAACTISGNKLYIAGGVGSGDGSGLSLTVFDFLSGNRCQVTAPSICGFGTFVGQSWDAFVDGDALVFTAGSSILDGSDKAAGFSISGMSESGCVGFCHTESDFCQANGYTSGTHCDGSESVTCGMRGDCAIEMAREVCPVSCNATTGICSGCIVGSGPCCDGAGNFRPNSYICSATHVATEYYCSGTGCGDNVMVRYQDQYCSGTSETCSGALVWDAGALEDDCLSNETCTAGDSTCNYTPSCSCVCTSGSCCDGCNYRPTTYKCAEDVATEYYCSGTGCGDDVMVHHQDQYCSGTSETCSGALVWDTGVLEDDCLSNETCTTGDSTCNTSASCLCANVSSVSSTWDRFPSGCHDLYISYTYSASPSMRCWTISGTNLESVPDPPDYNWTDTGSGSRSNYYTHNSSCCISTATTLSVVIACGCNDSTTTSYVASSFVGIWNGSYDSSIIQYRQVFTTSCP